MIKTFEELTVPNVKIPNKTIIILLVVVGVIALHNPIFNLIGSAIDHVFELTWYLSGLLDKLIWGVKPQ